MRCAAAASLENLVQIVCRRREALLVIRLAAQSGHDDVVRRGARLQRQQPHSIASSRARLHTTPHLRRSSHSAIGSPSSSRKTIGMSHSSLVLRTEMPASE